MKNQNFSLVFGTIFVTFLFFAHGIFKVESMTIRKVSEIKNDTVNNPLNGTLQNETTSDEEGTLAPKIGFSMNRVESFAQGYGGSSHTMAQSQGYMHGIRNEWTGQYQPIRNDIQQNSFRRKQGSGVNSWGSSWTQGNPGYVSGGSMGGYSGGQGSVSRYNVQTNSRYDMGGGLTMLTNLPGANSSDTKSSSSDKESSSS